MKAAFLFGILLISIKNYAQCSSVSLEGELNNCLGTKLTVSPASGVSYAQIAWFNGNNLVNTVYSSVSSTNGVTVAGGNGLGPAANQLIPGGLYVDGNGNIYVIDVDNSRVQKWAPGATSGVTVAGGNGAGNAANQLNYPLGLAVDKSGNLFIADASNNRVQMWAPGAVNGITIGGQNQPLDPIAIAIDNNGSVFVADGNQVLKWLPGTNSWQTVAGGPMHGTAANQFYGIYGLALDLSGNLYVADNGNGRIQKWAPGAISGITVAGGNGYGTGANQLDSPLGIFVDGDGNLYVADYGNERITKWPPGATNGITVAGGNGQGIAADQLYEPWAIFLDGSGNLYISDGFNYRVQKWTVPTIDRTYIPTVPGSYTAVITTDAGCTVTTNPVIINTIVTPSVEITVPTTTVNKCEKVTFSALPTNGGLLPSYQWQVNGQNVGTSLSNYTNSNMTDGDKVTCMLTSNAVCVTSTTAVSNPLIMAVNKSASASIKITASADSSCSGTPIKFIATVANSESDPVYQWQVNGRNVGSGSEDYTSVFPVNMDMVTCTVSDNAACILGISNTIVLTVFPDPEIPPGQSYTVTAGQSLLLSPTVTGDIGTYLWIPGTGLSDSTIRNPVANPVRTMEYGLKVTSVDGCEAAGKVIVNVSSELRIPNAFTPNNDGNNDVFYVLGGPYGSQIEELDIFDRWGQMVFHSQNKMPDDVSGGWNGTYKGKQAQTGSYIYMLRMRFANGSKEVFKGTVLLIR